MAEKSFLWTTGSVGDGTNTYTRADTSAFSQVLAAVHDDEGVAPGLLNALAGSVPGANTVRINTGGALVDGKPYLNDSTVDVNIPSAVGGGNTRIDRIVLRADWTAQTVRIHRIAGTDAASPTAPAITQDPGNVYDLPLYRVLVTTAGAVTLTDERKLGQVGTAGLEDGALSANAAGRAKMENGFLSADSAGRAKMADGYVDDTKVGNRVPKLTRRIGGDPTQWDVDGVKVYSPGKILIQVGAAVSMGDSQAYVTFPIPYAGRPLVFLQNSTLAQPFITWSIYSLSNTGFIAQAIKHDPTSHVWAGEDRKCYWIAIGPTE